MAGDPALEARFVGSISPTAGRNGAGAHPCQGPDWTRPKTAIITTHDDVEFAEPCIAKRPEFVEGADDVEDDPRHREVAADPISAWIGDRA